MSSNTDNHISTDDDDGTEFTKERIYDATFSLESHSANDEKVTVYK